MCVISNFFAEKLNDEFDVISCEECNVIRFWKDAPAFAVWSPENKPHQLDHFECVHEKLKQTVNHRPIPLKFLMGEFLTEKMAVTKTA